METRIITLDMPLPLLAALEDTAHRRRITLGQLLRDELSRTWGVSRPGLGDDAADGEPVDHDDIVIDRFDSGPRR